MTFSIARHNAKTLCIIGTGEQAKGIAEAVFAVRAKYFVATPDKAPVRIIVKYDPSKSASGSPV